MKQKYIKTPVKNNIKDASKQETERILKNIDAWAVLWHLVKRHKFGLVTTWAVTITALYVFPPLPYIIISLIK